MSVMKAYKKYFFSLKKRDGRIVGYDVSKIEKVFKELGRIFGQIDEKTAENLAFLVEEKLKKIFLPGETLTAEIVSEEMEKILGENGFSIIAKAYKNFHELRDEAKKNIQVQVSNEKNIDSTDISLMVITEASSRLHSWDKTKIMDALIKEAGLDPDISYEVAQRVEKKVLDSNLKQVTTSLIRELVDIELFSIGLGTKLKKQKSLGIPLYNLEEVIFSKTQENSNLAANNPEAVNLAVAENILKQYALSYIFSKEVSEAHLKARIHIHDLGYPTRVYCSTHSLEYIKKFGLELENLNIISKPAKHAKTLTGHLNTFLSSMQAYYAGALGIAYTNIAYAPYLVGMSHNELIQEAQYLIFSCAQNAFSRGGQTLFIDFNIHTGIPEYLKDVPAIGPGGEYTGKTYKDYEKETQNFAKALMEVWRNGDANGHVFEFPKMDLHVNQDTFSDPTQYEILELASQISSENGSPYFIFDRDEVTLSQCCRLRTTLDLSNEYDYRMVKKPESMRFCGFQNITINLPQAAYRAGKGNIQGAIDDILESMDICVKAHFQKKDFIAKLMRHKGLPLWQIGKIAMDGFPYVDLEKCSYIIGMIGLNECVEFLTGEQLHESDNAFKVGIKIISSMFLKINTLGKQHGLKFVLEESPAESAARRLAKVDIKEYPISTKYIKGDIEKDAFYYTNSIHFAPEIDMPIVERIQKQSKFHSLIAAGAIIHAFIGEEKPSPQSIMNLVRKTWENTNAAQITISPEFTICNSCHKMIRGVFDKCQNCGAENINGVNEIYHCEC
ncbi:MAG: anaerobic ribonucleoside-triphosphate reductase [Elusimicrobiota bacterium]|jgi:ribonucleoside-triphosphate reductase|nr:anaerobic ribonucleoside-triphosphate reductase [Elusimicrobiota bacterium]